MKKYNYIHFVTDEKFIRDEIRCFEEASLTTNQYFFIGTENKKFEFTKNYFVIGFYGIILLLEIIFTCILIL